MGRSRLEIPETLNKIKRLCISLSVLNEVGKEVSKHGRKKLRKKGREKG
jgi:hypothetical protein